MVLPSRGFLDDHRKESEPCNDSYAAWERGGYICKMGCGLVSSKEKSIWSHENYLCDRTNGRWFELKGLIEGAGDRRVGNWFGRPMEDKTYAGGKIRYCNTNKEWNCTRCTYKAGEWDARSIFAHARTKHGNGSEASERRYFYRRNEIELQNERMVIQDMINKKINIDEHMDWIARKKF